MASKRSMAVPMLRRTAPIAVVIMSFVVAGCVAESPEVVIDDPVLIEGRDIYVRNCASCHGPAGDGGVGRKISGGAVVDAFPAIEAQIELVRDGRNNMPAYGDRLTAEQIEAVVRYTREVL